MNRVIEIRPGERPRLESWPTLELEALQAFVGGSIETAFRVESAEGKGGIVGFCNEEGRISTPPLPFCLVRSDGQRILGPVAVIGYDAEGNERGLSPVEVVQVGKRWREGARFFDDGRSS